MKMLFPSNRQRCAALCSILAVFIMSCCGVLAFVSPTTSTSASAKQRIRGSMLFEGPSSANSGEMVLARDGDRLLNVAFSALDDRDKYETVLTGLCAKVIDGGASNAKDGLVDPIRLMEEMNGNGITTGPRGIISLIDVSALAYNYVSCVPLFDVYTNLIYYELEYYILIRSQFG
jgi:hypothetical protein